MIENFSKFKRFFAFGCSYTNYIWPTWADVINSEIQGEFHNLGRRGSGNLYISCRIAEANRRYNFCETDLIAVMFTSFTREDRYVNGQWMGDGNIYNQQYYPPDFVKKFADPDFYLIRDMALIDTTTTYIKSLPCESLILSAWPVDLLENNNLIEGFSEKVVSDCKKIYKNNIGTLDLRSWQESYYNINKNNPNFEKYGYTYVRNGSQFSDGHPNTMTYYEYLKHINVPLTDKSKQYSDQSYQKLLTCKNESDIIRVFTECAAQLPKNNKHGLF
jgi:hypothetical protein